MNGKTENFRIDVADAVELIAANMPAYPSVRLPLADTVGSILRERITAERDQPPFDRVTMDGIAVRSTALAGGLRRFRVLGVQGAGVAGMALVDERNCVEIMTGATLPDDADTVIPVERIRTDGEDVVLEDGYVPEPGQFVHRRGTDHESGHTMMEPGAVIGAAEMAALTISGKAELEVSRWPDIAVISTGDELVDVGRPLETFQIRSSNDRAIAAALENLGCRTARRSRLPDEPEELRKSISRMHADHDVLILSGGVSMGKYDYVPQIMEELGAELVFHKILQKPGLPMWFGVSVTGKPVFALPGNPVSTLVCTIRYVTPAILGAMGLAFRPQPRFRLAEPLRFAPDLTCFMPVQLTYTEDGEALAVPKPTNTSGDFVSLAGTDGFVELERGRDEFPAGHPVPFFRW
ncbi:MAG: molybdopterin molybdotransferase MoeA [Gammaproteobacteria bacterium]